MARDVSTGLKATRHRVCAALCLLLVQFVLAPPSALAADQARRLSELKHRAWTVEDGAPAGVRALAQTRDGYLWIGTTTGLYRFDGARFQAAKELLGSSLLSQSINCLLVSSSGVLWIGYVTGGASFLQDGRLRHYSEDSGMPMSSVNSIAQDADGQMWAGTSTGLLRLIGERWTPVRMGADGSDIFVRKLAFDRDGRLWVARSLSVISLPRGASEFLGDAIEDYYGSIAQSRDGTIWLADGKRGVRPHPLTAGSGTRHRDRWIAEHMSRGLMFDRHDNLWSSTDAGVVRINADSVRSKADASAAFAEKFDVKDGLSGDEVRSTLEDREGNIWIGTNGGVDQFREVPFVRIATPPEAQYFSLAPSDDGSMWIGTISSGLFVARGDRAERAEGPTEIGAIYRDDQNDLWLGVPRGLWRYHGTSRDEFPLLPPLLATDAAIGVQGMAKDAQGTLWVAFEPIGLYRLVGKQWQAVGSLPGLPPGRPLAVAADQKRRVWLGYPLNRAVRIDGTEVRTFGMDQGLEIGGVLALSPREDHAWLGGELGVARFDGQRFQMLRPADEGGLSAVTGIVEARSGELWLHAAEGVLRISPQEIRRFVDEPNYRPVVQRLSYLDGLPGTIQGIRPLPSAVESSDGRLWFATSKGVVWIDPSRIPHNPLVPAVHIQAVTVDGREQDVDAGQTTLPVKANSLEISYTALSLTVPERVQFRYRLDGFDSHWQDAGSRRTAFYTNLRPGAYTFRVIAANNDGVWNETGDQLSLAIPPTFLQTDLFRVLCAAAFVVLLWLAYRLRMQQVAAGIRARLEERLFERERIARDLHDTLLQSMHGLIFRFQAATERLPPDEPIRTTMSKELDYADEVLAESRDRLSGLRSAGTATMELSESFAMRAATLANPAQSELKISLKGQPRQLHPMVREEAYHIGAEALANAFRHANAKHIELEVIYDRNEVSVRVRDDGIGMDASDLNAMIQPGHWGLIGMRERAERIRAKLSVWSRPNAGTEVVLRVGSVMAYRTRGRSNDRLGTTLQEDA